MFQFKDKELQERFEQDGFVKFRLLTDEQADQLYQFYMENKAAHEVAKGLYHSTTDTANPALVDKVDRFISPILETALKEILTNYELMISGFLIKESGAGSETGVHQDPSFVDESRYVSGNVWVALHDIGHNNGNMFFVKGSHRMLPSLRIAPRYPKVFDDVRELIPAHITEVPVLKGEAILINHALIHGATANLAGTPRLVAAMAIRSAGAEWIYHYLDENNSTDKIEQYRINRESIMTLPKDGRPLTGELLGYVSGQFPKINKPDFLRFMRSQNRSKSFVKRILSTILGK